MDISGFLVEFVAWALWGFKSKSKKTIRVPVTHVDHSKDGSWHFYSGNHQSKIRFENYSEALESDSTLSELSDMPIGYSAERNIQDSSWIILKTA